MLRSLAVIDTHNSLFDLTSLMSLHCQSLLGVNLYETSFHRMAAIYDIRIIQIERITVR